MSALLLTHQLKQCKVLLPPEVLLVLWPHGGHHVVCIHDDVDYVVHKIRECAVSTCNATPSECRTVRKFSVELLWSSWILLNSQEDFETMLQLALPLVSGHLIEGQRTDVWRSFRFLWLSIVERRVKRDEPTGCNWSDVYYQTSISTCFGQRYAHHQEIKTVCYCIWCSAMVVLAVVVCSWVVSCVHSSAHSCTAVHSLFQHVSGIIMPIIRR